MNADTIVAVTHDGVFHSDEVMAIALLRIAAAPTKVQIVRSRAPEVWLTADYLIDVGGKCDDVKYFDHHMRNGAGTRNGVPYSAFGLVFKTLGRTAVRNVLKQIVLPCDLSDEDINEVVSDVVPLVLGVDSHDQALLNSTFKFTPDKSIYLEVLTLQQVISNFNPVPILEKLEEPFLTQQFSYVVDFAENLLRRFILRKASRILSEAFIRTYDRGDAILVLPSYCDSSVPVGKRPYIKFIVYPSTKGDSFTVQAVKKGGGQSNISNLRVPLPAAWAGLTDNALTVASGVPDATFCHRDRFIAAAKTMHGALAMANKAIEQNQP